MALSGTELQTPGAPSPPELPALPDALEERHEVPRDLVLLVLEADGPLAVVGLDAVVAEAPARSIESRRWRTASDTAADA